MKNREKFRDEIVERARAITVTNVCEFIEKNVLPHFCEGGCDSVNCNWCRALLDLWFDEEYVEPQKPLVDWSKVPVDTLVRVRNRKENEWVMRYFKGIDEKRHSYKFQVWTDGKTSKTVGGCGMETWKYCELVEVEDE